MDNVFGFLIAVAAIVVLIRWIAGLGKDHSSNQQKSSSPADNSTNLPRMARGVIFMDLLSQDGDPSGHDQGEDHLDDDPVEIPDAYNDDFEYDEDCDTDIDYEETDYES